jgi:hypothetical protein
MKKKFEIRLCSVLCLLFFFSIVCAGNVFGGGGGPQGTIVCPSDNCLPEATKNSERVVGEFYAFLDKGQCSIDNPSSEPEGCGHYNVIVKLERWKKKKSPDKFKRCQKKEYEVHFFSFPATAGLGNLCDLSDEQLKETFKRIPCSAGVGEAFNVLDKIPVIYSLEILEKECVEGGEEAIQGSIVVSFEDPIPDCVTANP